jgi:MEMO1 family protein
MTHSNSLVFVGIAPHPPIMVPEVGREAIVEVRSSIDAMGDLTQRLIESGAETVILISPHAPLEASAFVAYDGPKLYGDFSNFRAPTATTHAELDEELLNEITRAAAEQALIVMRIRGYDFDHGTAVPLYFLQRNGWSGKVVALGYSFLSNEDHLRFGRCIQRAVEKVNRPVAFIASGDLSHRLKPGAPAGYNSAAHLFDEEVVDAIRTAKLTRIVDIDQEMRHTAGECGYRSMLVAIGAGAGVPPACEVISYEAPFGVGYLVAQLVAASLDASSAVSEPGVITGEPDDSSVTFAQTSDSGDLITNLARRTIETFVGTGKVIVPPDLPPGLTARAGCFVSIKTHAGDLRGCIGTIDPAKHTLAEEIIWNAVSAATRDPRFSPVEKEELPDLKYSVDVMSVAEPCTLADLDPKIFGVIVEDPEGLRRGLLLPNLAGIRSAAQQVEIASRKAGILSGAPVRLFRFSSQRYSE